ncbi:hypothetical protein NVV94_04490 [Pseudomonas sp. LS1212]|uniref:hypothetical protein n=1 Tax=Pseudomonas sp. LS1212 TaxID=2972478 RepID=UPI00215B89F3|nr:hypothetical protein [Pseudomonas sp. LS1212]UVJ44850.1 hypothetical protein NVV94_04490 [Pseudomonas sp. LS1212]
MSKFSLSILGIAALATTMVTVIAGCSGAFDRIADTVLANEVRFDDQETPRTAYAISASADEVQSVGGQGSGLSCSLPLGTQTLAFTRGSEQAPIALQMRQACAFHDYCYRHGNATYGYSQADCDFMLQQQAFRLCKYITPSASISECETNARKVTIGVRLGGFGSFKRARALEDAKASTFMEFDPYPVRANTHQVVRIADAPRQWVREGLLTKAAYHFDIRPSGSRVHVLGWKPGGSMVCSSFELPASYNAINGPPMVVRDSPRGEDWFVWWRRDQLTNTYGEFAILPPGRATRQDWVEAAGGFTPRKPAGHCEHREMWSDASAAQLLAFVIKNRNFKFSELHPVNGADTPGVVRLMGLSTHSCSSNKAIKDRSPCVVDVAFDTRLRQLHEEPGARHLYRVTERNCRKDKSEGPRTDTCDRYRNYVGAPFVVAHATPPSLIWTRRGSGNGDGYEEGARVRHYTVGKPGEDVATDLGEKTLTAFPESMEPAFITNATSANPTFVSLVAGQDGVQLRAQAAVPKGEQSVTATLECLRNAPTSWLHRPTYLVPDPHDANRSYMVFSRVRLKDMQNKVLAQAAELDVAVATLVGGACSASAVSEFTFPDFFKYFAEQEELDALVAANKAPGNADPVALGQYAERVRGGQMILADITGDGVPDLVQIAEIKKEGRFRAGLLKGTLNTSGLRFSELSEQLSWTGSGD